MRPNGFNIQRSIECPQSLLIQLNSGLEKAFGRAGYDDADIDELLTLDFGDNADDGAARAISPPSNSAIKALGP